MKKYTILILALVLVLGLIFTGCARANNPANNNTGVTNNGTTGNGTVDNANGTGNDAGTDTTNTNGNGVAEGGVTSRRVAGTTAEQVYAYIREINEQARTVTFEEVELVRSEDNLRRNQLGLQDGDFQNGLYRYNTARVSRMLPLATNLTYNMNDEVAGALDYSSGVDYINGAIDAKRDSLYCLTVENGQVVAIRDCDTMSANDLDTLNNMNTNNNNLNNGLGLDNNLGNNTTRDLGTNPGNTNNLTNNGLTNNNVY